MESSTNKRKMRDDSIDDPTERRPPSQRALKRAQILEEHGSVGQTNAPKGTTRKLGNHLEWLDKEKHLWHPAAPHDEYRSEFVREDNELGSYDILPDQGEDAWDVTTFASAYGQQHWNLNDRSTWANVRDEEGNEVLYLLEKPIREEELAQPGYMIHNGLIMLDPDDNPIIDWPGIPRCFSSKVEGGRMEALRRICGMRIPDFRARMPRNILMKNGVTKPLFGLTSLNQRISRFRDNNDCPPWLNRAGGLRMHTLERLAATDSPPLSTANLSAPSAYEVERRKYENRGKNPERAGDRYVSEEKRQARAREHKRRLQRLAGQECAQRSPPINQHSSIGVPDYDFEGENEVTPVEFDFGVEGGDLTETAPSRPQDLRYVAPRTLAERFSIKSALLPTCLDYLYYHGEGPPSISDEKSYTEQYREIEANHYAKWCQPGDPPRLVGLPEWHGSFSLLPMPDLTDEAAGRLLGTSPNRSRTTSPQSAGQSLGDIPVAHEVPGPEGSTVRDRDQSPWAAMDDQAPNANDNDLISIDEFTSRFNEEAMHLTGDPTSEEDFEKCLNENPLY